jgi:hypothetical protein
MNESNSVRLRWGVLAALAMTFLALYPQINLWLVRGREWNGAYVMVHGDEAAYSAYIQALINGRPRRNNPYTGRDDAPGVQQPESLFSIQFIPAYAVALPARALGVSAATAFIALLVLTAIGATLTISWLLTALTGDGRLGAAGALIVLCFGTVAAGQGEVAGLLHSSFVADSFLFLRRYQPAAAFPLFFVNCILLWRMLTSATFRRALLWATLSGLLFGILIFSYFYLWTAAAAWLACLAVLWLAGRPTEWKRTAACFAVIGGWATVALIPYAVLLSHRAANTDAGQLLVLSRAPDLFRIPELMGMAIVLALVAGVARGLVPYSDRRVLFLASFALMPLAIFNQQIVTGRSLQPFHYQWFVVNYLVLIALVATAFILWQERGGTKRSLPSRIVALIALVAFSLGMVEMAGATKRGASYARVCDEAMKVGQWLAEAAKHDGTRSDAVREGHAPRPVVFTSSLWAAGILPTLAPQSMLFVWHVNSFPTPALGESRRLFLKYLYYSGANQAELERSFLEARPEILTAFFGVHRVLPDMAVDPKPISVMEASAELEKYAAYIDSFTRADASVPLLSYVVVPTDNTPDLANIDRWYERDVGERVGLFTIYRVRLRPSPEKREATE